MKSSLSQAAIRLINKWLEPQIYKCRFVIFDSKRALDYDMAFLTAANYCKYAYVRRMKGSVGVLSS